jgi:putative phosphoribosyl transferase
LQLIERPNHTYTSRVRLRVDEGVLPGVISIPEKPAGAVLFAHDGGADSSNPRDSVFSNVLNHYGLATLLIDLLTPIEHKYGYLSRGCHFDVDLQSERLVKAIDWLCAQDQLTQRPIGLFGASTGAAVAIGAAAERAAQISAVVCRGGRPELAGERLFRVEAPTLFIVGGEDEFVIDLNRDCARHMHCKHRVHVVPGATHLFDEAGKLEEVERLAREWFLTHLGVGLH